ncbi:MAG: hypothetical protein Q8942_12555 [Bacillota bacterium]|nr:hypothetical protein [Bacillota bacterium]
MPYIVLIFMIALISCCVVNLLKQHYIIQLAGISFLFTYLVFKTYYAVNNSDNLNDIIASYIPALTGISACLIGMVLGFWIFPQIRKKLNKVYKKHY